jgi:hypothetical protein
MAVTNDQIAQRAFEIWEREGRPQGRDQDHWYQAEAELRKDTVRAAEAPIVPSPAPKVLQPSKKPAPKNSAIAPIPAKKAKGQAQARV